MLLCCSACGTNPQEQKDVAPDETTKEEITTEAVLPAKTATELIGDAILLRGNYGTAAEKKIAEIYKEVCKKDPEQGQLWSDILRLSQ